MLSQTVYGFSVEKDNPFLIFPYLRKYAAKYVPEKRIIDLSRGDPGFYFTPSTISRQFFSYLLFLDSVLNTAKNRFSDFEKKDIKKLETLISELTSQYYSPKIAAENLENLDFFSQKIIAIAALQKVKYTKYDVLFQFFKKCSISGGSYGNPQGQEITRIVLADWHQQTLNTAIDYQDLILTNGGSHAIGILFKILGRGGGMAYLRQHDEVLITSPSYSPYMACLERRNLKIHTLSIDPFNGQLPKESIEFLKKYPRDVRAIILIDPNNPTGFSLDQKMLKEIADFARRKNALVITDEVYSPFFENKKTMIDLCAERTIRISSRSKIERAAGMRFGEIMISQEGQKYISEKILGDYLEPAKDIMKAILLGKGPGGTCGELHHTTFVPVPMQFLGVCHILLGKKERGEFRQAIKKNRDLFHQILGLPHKNNAYYVIFDLNNVKGAKKKSIPIEQKLLDLAKMGVIYLPSYNFFSASDKLKRNLSNTVRASVVNCPPEDIKIAAAKTLKYLGNL